MSRRRAGAIVRLYRRSATLMMFERRGRLVAADYALNIEQPLSLTQFTVLAALDGWSSVSDTARCISHLRPKAVLATLKRLHAWQLIEASDEPSHPRRDALETWGGWLPEAGFFHFSKRDLRRIGLREATRLLGRKVALFTPPPPVKPVAGILAPLDPYPKQGALPRVLLARRSWRRFGAGAVTRREVSTLLGLTWGVQRWMHVVYGIRSALKTSPSSGATHSLEVYLVAQKIRGLPRGIYRYCPDSHKLELVRARIARNAVRRYLGQPWFENCAAAFVMTSIWARVQFKYGSPRTYASVLIEAGHFAQTFCLLATWLGLAPFCTGAFLESTVERALKIDGIGEGAIYATGVGKRPKGVAWAPWPDPRDTPRTSPPALRKTVTRGNIRR